MADQVVPVSSDQGSDAGARVEGSSGQPEGAGDSATADTTAQLLARLSAAGQIRIIKHATPLQHVVVWLVGVVVASLLPFLVLYFHGIDTSSPPGMFELLSRGDLLIISLVFTIAGLAELALVFNRIHQEQLLAAALLVIGGTLLITTEALWYSDITAQLLRGGKVTSIHAVAFGSLALFGVSTFCSSICVRLAAGVR